MVTPQLVLGLRESAWRPRRAAPRAEVVVQTAGEVTGGLRNAADRRGRRQMLVRAD